MSVQKCSICGNSSGNIPFSFTDYNMGSSQRFSYFQCSSCGCLQKSDPEEDNSNYYPVDYYSFSLDDQTTLRSKAKWLIRNIRNEYYRSGKGVLGKLISRILPCGSISMIHKVKPLIGSKILDVGCGNDALMLQYLSSIGYQNLVGIDPYISSDHLQFGTAHVYKKVLTEISGEFDLIVFNHSFEHMNNQKEILSHCSKILGKSGKVVITIPTVDSYAWRTFKEFWPNLDVPRHLFLHSVKSVGLLAEACGFSIETTYRESTSFQFWGKKLYEKKIPLFSSDKYHRLVRLWYRLLYSLMLYKKVEYLDQNSDGDTIMLVLKKQ